MTQHDTIHMDSEKESNAGRRFSPMMKKTKSTMLSLQPIPKTLVSCRDKNGRNNALVVGFAANVRTPAGPVPR